MSTCVCFNTAEPVANQMESFSEIARCGCGLNVTSSITQKLYELAFTYLETTVIEMVRTRITKTAGLWFSWDVQTSSVVRSSLDSLLARRFNLLKKQKKQNLLALCRSIC